MHFAVESWIWYSFAVGIIVARIISRIILFGSLKGLQYDDYIMGIFTAASYTVLIVMSNREAEAQSNLLPPGFNTDTLTPAEISHREYGSKIVIVVEQMQIAVIWSCKACLLILYYRLTDNVASGHHRAIRLLAMYVAFGFVVMEILYFAAWCRPFPEYWAVPTKNSQCNALINHRITNAIFNISSDLIMLCIALPLFIRSLLPIKRKLILCGIFSLGIFVILAAVLNKYYSFTNPYEPTWIFWYTRESSTAILVANLPFTWTLLRKLFNLGAFDEAHPPPPTYHSSRTAGGRRTARAHQPHHAHHASGSHSHEKHTDSNGSGSRGSRPMSLIGSICARKEDTDLDRSAVTNSQNSRNAFLDRPPHAHDFAPQISLPATLATADPDLERGLSTLPSPDSPTHLSARPVTPRPVTPARSRSPHITPDGTGGFVTAPRTAHLAPVSSVPSRVSTSADGRHKPGSADGSSISTLPPASPPRTGAGGGRSAADRKRRARLSH